MTAANSTPLTDGASTVLLASEEWAEAHGIPVLAYFTECETAAVDFVHGGEGLLMAPAYAVPRMLERAGLTLQDFDYYEIHEAFASQVLSTLKAWEDPVFCKERLGLDAPLGSIDRSKLNVNGSSLAAGHPFAATGGRIVANLAKLLHESAASTGEGSSNGASRRPDLDLRRRRPGRHRHPGDLTRDPSQSETPNLADPSHAEISDATRSAVLGGGGQGDGGGDDVLADLEGGDRGDRGDAGGGLLDQHADAGELEGAEAAGVHVVGEQR